MLLKLLIPRRPPPCGYVYLIDCTSAIWQPRGRPHAVMRTSESKDDVTPPINNDRGASSCQECVDPVRHDFPRNDGPPSSSSGTIAASRKHPKIAVSLATHQHQNLRIIFLHPTAGGERCATRITAHEHCLGSGHMAGHRRAAGFDCVVKGFWRRMKHLRSANMASGFRAL